MIHTPTSPLTETGPDRVPGAPGPAAAREAMVARLEAAGQLQPGPLCAALLAARREVLLPQAYVRRSTPGVEPPQWDLLDWASTGDRVARTWTPPGILGHLGTTSFENAGLFPDTVRHDVFERTGRRGWTAAGAGGVPR